jgi:hypothetical protein
MALFPTEFENFKLLQLNSVNDNPFTNDKFVAVMLPLNIQSLLNVLAVAPDIVNFPFVIVKFPVVKFVVDKVSNNIGGSNTHKPTVNSSLSKSIPSKSLNNKNSGGRSTLLKKLGLKRKF